MSEWFLFDRTSKYGHGQIDHEWGRRGIELDSPHVRRRPLKHEQEDEQANEQAWFAPN